MPSRAKIAQRYDLRHSTMQHHRAGGDGNRQVLLWLMSAYGFGLNIRM